MKDEGGIPSGAGRTGMNQAEHPTGTVTFLFTDIEGSTRLAREFPTGLPAALARHHEMVRQAIERNHGHVFQIVGDAFCAAFHHADDGLQAALAAQRALQNHNSQIPIEDQNGDPRSPTIIRVRMGLHTGDAEFRDGSYHGYLTLAHAQRIMSAANGGQVLLSNQSEVLLRERLPDGVGLRDLGAVLLKDFPRAEHVFQLVAPDLWADFPALKSLATIPNNLPAQLTSFIGREKEVAEVKRLLATTRLLTLTGSGGTGKTRLSLRVAEEFCGDASSEPHYSDGVWFVELAPVTDPALVPQTVATVLGLRDETGQALTERLAGFLRDKQALLILDNCEHLLEGCARLSDTLLRAAPNVKIIASSREALGIAGETTYHVPSLATPGGQPSEIKTQPSDLLQYAAVRLFVERAAAAKPGFTLHDANAHMVAQICARLDGIPLAIELAAARVRALPVEQIAARLDDRFRLLTGGSRTALPRQQTLRALIDWSHALLTEPERVLLRRLSVFAGGWTLEAAEAVAGSKGKASSDLGRDDILDLLTRLVEKSLVNLDEQAAEPRYVMLETIRQYARDKLLESDEGESLRDAHLSYFTTWAERMVPRLQGGPDQLGCFDRWELDFDNVRASLEWALGKRLGELSLRLVAASYLFWSRRGFWAEGRMWVERVLASADRTTPSIPLAQALWQAGFLASVMDDAPRAKALVEESLAVAGRLGTQYEVPHALHTLYAATSLSDEPSRVLARFDEVVALAHQLGNQDAVAGANMNAAFYALSTGEYSRAQRYVENALLTANKLQDHTFTPVLRRTLGYVLLHARDQRGAAEQFAASLRENQALKDMGGIVRCLSAFATLAGVRGDVQRSARLTGAFERQFSATGTIPTASDRQEYAFHMAAILAQLPDPAFEAARAEGAVMSLAQAIAYALEDDRA